MLQLHQSPCTSCLFNSQVSARCPSCTSRSSLRTHSHILTHIHTHTHTHTTHTLTYTHSDHKGSSHKPDTRLRFLGQYSLKYHRGYQSDWSDSKCSPALRNEPGWCTVKAIRSAQKNITDTLINSDTHTHTHTHTYTHTHTHTHTYPHIDKPSTLHSWCQGRNGHDCATFLSHLPPQKLSLEFSPNDHPLLGINQEYCKPDFLSISSF